jgi:hypothetical protein
VPIIPLVTKDAFVSVSKLSLNTVDAVATISGGGSFDSNFESKSADANLPIVFAGRLKNGNAPAAEMHSERVRKTDADLFID